MLQPPNQMKRTLYTLCLTAPLLFAENSVKQDSYIHEITQVNTWVDDLGVSRRNELLLSERSGQTVGITGKRKAMSSIMGRSVFELMTTNETTNVDTILKTVTVDSYMAEVNELIIIGPLEDPYNMNPDKISGFIPRTQIGQGYTIQSHISGLLPEGNGIPKAASSLKLEQASYAYAENKATLIEDADPILFTSNITKNGLSQTAVLSRLTGSDMTKLRGEDVVTIYMKADPESGHPDENVMATAKIQIWPISDGSLTGILEGKTYSKVPALTLDLIDLYPGSDTYLSITGGSLEQPLIYGNRTNTSNTPLSIKYSLTDLDKRLISDGVYNVQLIHRSPFDEYVFSESSFTLQRGIHVNASIITSE